MSVLPKENDQVPSCSDILEQPEPVYRILEKLPYELIGVIVSQVSNREDLCSLARVNKLFRELAEPHLYRDVLIREGFQARNLARNIQRRPERATWIRSLKNACRDDSFDGLPELPDAIAMMTMLEDLLVETPDCNAFEAEIRRPWVALQDLYQKIFLKASLPRSDVLPCLRSCTLHYVDERRSLYSLGDHSIIFLHSTLQDLTISCASIDPPHKLHPLLHQSDLTNTTPLTTVNFIECDFHPKGLYHLLRLPRSLVSLSLTEATHYAFYSRDRRYPGFGAQPNILHPIHAHQPNLQYLHIARIRPARDFLFFIPPLDLTPFTVLRSVHFAFFRFMDHQGISWCDLVHRSGPQMNTGGPNTTSLVYGDIPEAWWGKAIEFFTCAFSNKISHGIEKLETLKLVLVDDGLTDEAHPPAPEEKERKRLAVENIKVGVRDLGKLGRKEDVGVRVIVEWVRPSGRTIPPYLVGEYVPEVRLEYDSGLEV